MNDHPEQAMIDFGMYDAYPQDVPLLKELGLLVKWPLPDGWADLGTVNLYADLTDEEREDAGVATVRVEVYRAPAQFWRFTVTRGGPPPEVLVLTTGSGDLTEHWPTAKLAAIDCLEVEFLAGPYPDPLLDAEAEAQTRQDLLRREGLS